MRNTNVLLENSDYFRNEKIFYKVILEDFIGFATRHIGFATHVT